jgi:hypothetical protein
MECKIDHTLENAIPEGLCIACHPRPLAAVREYTRRDVVEADQQLAKRAELYDRKVKRKLKAEVKAWRERVEALERHTMAGPALAKARETLRKAETDLYMVL